MKKKLTFEEVCSHFGSKARLALQLGITSQAINNWGGLIPSDRAIQIERMTHGGLKAVDMPLKMDSVA